MKPSTIFLAEMTNPELEHFLKKNDAVFVPVGAMEQHGPAGPLGTDTFVPVEIAGQIDISVGSQISLMGVNLALIIETFIGKPGPNVQAWQTATAVPLAVTVVIALGMIMGLIIIAAVAISQFAVDRE